MMTDPISDMLSRMRNAIVRKYDHVEMPASKIKIKIAHLFQEEGFVRGVEAVTAKGHPAIRIQLKYVKEEPVISGMRRVSRPGRRVYVGKDKIPKVRGGLGVAVVSTTQGIMTDRESRKRNLGGEVICFIW